MNICIYMYIDVCVYVCMYIYIHMYIYPKPCVVIRKQDDLSPNTKHKAHRTHFSTNARAATPHQGARSSPMLNFGARPVGAPQWGSFSDPAGAARQLRAEG